MVDEQAVDNQLFEARAMMHELFEGEDGPLTEEQVFTLMRLAYGKGYIDAHRQPDRETRHRVAEALGLLNTATGEIYR